MCDSQPHFRNKEMGKYFWWNCIKERKNCAHQSFLISPPFMIAENEKKRNFFRCRKKSQVPLLMDFRLEKSFFGRPPPELQFNFVGTEQRETDPLICDVEEGGVVVGDISQTPSFWLPKTAAATTFSTKMIKTGCDWKKRVKQNPRFHCPWLVLVWLRVVHDPLLPNTVRTTH